MDTVDPATPTLVGASRRDGTNVSERREGTSVCDHVGGEAMSFTTTEGIENSVYVGVGVMLGFNFSQFRKASLTSIDGDGIVDVNGILLTEGGGDREGLTIVTGASGDCAVGITGCSGKGVGSV